MNEEVRSVSSTGGEKGTKPDRHDLLPVESIAKIARHFGVGAEKYDDHNWRRGYEWSKSYAALQRHLTAFWAGEDIDEETGSPHLAAAGFHILALLEFMDRFPQFDDRYKTRGEAISPVAGTQLHLPGWHSVGEVFDEELPTISGYYDDAEGDTWKFNADRKDGDFRWTIVKDGFQGIIPEKYRGGDWTEVELFDFMPFTRVVNPE